ncbi:DUF3887 domain-containing protein [Haloarchaeobius amylolyticus]|uniref:DUF3887 domain-containing protein n=1 Tax=Haloarchaeobius amylolyticus TaxID=1198296 RepID=UPI002271AA10|nr:DUF3887 domain-containing protein [Haloarchaeobius amylolyticus]
MADPLPRRNLLQTLAAGGLAALAGCSGGSETDAPATTAPDAVPNTGVKTATDRPATGATGTADSTRSTGDTADGTGTGPQTDPGTTAGSTTAGDTPTGGTTTTRGTTARQTTDGQEGGGGGGGGGADGGDGSTGGGGGGGGGGDDGGSDGGGAETTARSPSQLRARGRDLTEALSAGRYAWVADAFVGSAAETVTATSLRDAWATQTRGLGTYTGIERTEHLVSEGYDVVLVQATFESGSLVVAWTFDAGGVVGIWLAEPDRS